MNGSFNGLGGFEDLPELSSELFYFPRQLCFLFARIWLDLSKF